MLSFHAGDSWGHGAPCPSTTYNVLRREVEESSLVRRMIFFESARVSKSQRCTSRKWLEH